MLLFIFYVLNIFTKAEFQLLKEYTIMKQNKKIKIENKEKNGKNDHIYTVVNNNYNIN